MRNMVIVGGSDAGISAALRAREVDPRIAPLIVTADRFPNFSICGLAYYIGGQVSHWKNLAHRTEEEIEKEGVTLLLEHTVQSIDAASKRILAVHAKGIAKTIQYDKLILGTGASSFRPAIAGIDNPGVFFLRWIPDSLTIDEFIRQKRPGTALIVGGGYIGMEMCEALVRRGIKVTLAEFADSVMPSFDADIGARIADTLSVNGVAVRNRVEVESIDRVRDGLVVRGPGFEVSADMVLVSVGSVPNSGLGRAIGIETGVKGALKVNLRMETTIPHVYAAGDCVETWHRLLQKYTYLPLGTVAHKQGRIAGENAAGGDSQFAGSLGTQSVKVFDRVLARTGLIEREAREAGFDPVSADIETWDHKAYYPPAARLFIRVTADRTTGRIAGAQMLGACGTEVSKRLDIFAAALHHGMTVREFSDYDLSYTPPLSAPWDPVQAAVHNLEKRM